MSFVYSTNLATHLCHPEAKAVEDLLEVERIKAHDFNNEIHKLQKEVQVLSERAQQSLVKEKALTDRCKEQVVLLSSPFQVSSFFISDLRNGNFSLPPHLLVTPERRWRSYSASFGN